MWTRAVWCVLRAVGRKGDPQLRHAGGRGKREEHHVAGGPAGSLGEGARHTGRDTRRSSAPTGVDRRAGAAVRLLPERHADPGRRPARHDEEPDRGTDQAGDERTSVPLRDVRRDHPCDQARGGRDGERSEGMSATEEKTIDVFGASLSRKRFVQGSGCLIVALGVPVTLATEAGAVPGNTVDPSKLASWIEIHPDNSVRVRTGQGEMGQGSASGAYAQIVAEELNLPYEAITDVVVGSTDQTPDGGLSAGFLMKRPGQTQPEIFGGGALNLQRAAAYTYQALLALASTQLGVPVGSLSAKNGVISAGGKSVTYGQLVSSGQFTLTIPTTGNAVYPPPALSDLTVTGNPPVKPPSQYSVVGTSQPMKAIPGIITGKTPYVADIHPPGMLHARIVRPPTLGSTLVSVGTVDKKAYPNAQVV